jgi:hypothetical protein
MNDNNSKFIANREFAYLRGGSYTTTSVGKEINSAKLILGKDISDEDFSFRLVIR